MRIVRAACALADPKHVRRAVVPIAAGAVDARQALLVVQQQRLVRGVKHCLGKARGICSAKSARLHKFKRARNFIAELVKFSLQLAFFQKAQIPLMHLVQVRKTAARKGAQQIQRRSALMIRLDHTSGIWLARRFVKLKAVDYVAAVARQAHAARLLKVATARLCELPCDATHLNDWTTRCEGKNDRHLKHHLKHIADIIRAKIIKTLRAIAALKQK